MRAARRPWMLRKARCVSMFSSLIGERLSMQASECESIFVLEIFSHWLMSACASAYENQFELVAMKNSMLVFFSLASTCAFAAEPAAHIDLGKFPAKTVEDVIVPV